MTPLNSEKNAGTKMKLMIIVGKFAPKPSFNIYIGWNAQIL